MKCINCNSEMYGSSKVRRNCGTFNEFYENKSSEIAKDPANNAPVLGVPVNPVSNMSNKLDYTLMNAYVGSSATLLQKVLAGKVNFCPIFLGPVYYAYRKMYGWAVIFMIIACVAGLILPLSSMIMIIIQCASFSSLYKNKMNSDIAFVKVNNQGKSETELIEIISKKGGTSILGGLYEV